MPQLAPLADMEADKSMSMDPDTMIESQLEQEATHSLLAASTPSSPLSAFSQSPSLPASPTSTSEDPIDRYPSPSVTTAASSGWQSPAKPAHSDAVKDNPILVSTADACPSPDGPPPAKKRRIHKPKVRTTEYLDLENADERHESRHLDRLLSVLRKKKKIVVVAGAGISVSAGVPDFRSSSGLFATLKSQHKLKGASGKHLFDAAVYRDNESTESFHTMVRELSALTKEARPTPFHHLLASLAAEGRLLRLYTQNVDGIDTAMEPLATRVPLNVKGPWPTTIQLHGGLEKMVCTKCSNLEDFDGSIFKGSETPLCKVCEYEEDLRINQANKRGQGIGRVRPRIALYNEPNADEDAIGNVCMADLRSRPDAVLVVGTSLKVVGVRRIVKQFCQVTRNRRDGFTAWINLEPEPQGVEFRDCWDLVVKGRCDDVAGLAQLTRWDSKKDEAQFVQLTPAELEASEKMLRRGSLEVRLLSPPLSQQSLRETDAPAGTKVGKVEKIQGILTPVASPRLSAKTTAQAPVRMQSKLSFDTGDASEPAGGAPARKPPQTTAKTKTKAQAPAKQRAPRGRKRKHEKPPLPNNTLQDTFKTVKNPVSARHVHTKKVEEGENGSVDGGDLKASNAKAETPFDSRPLPTPGLPGTARLPRLRPSPEPTKE